MIQIYTYKYIEAINTGTNIQIQMVQIGYRYIEDIDATIQIYRYKYIDDIGIDIQTQMMCTVQYRQRGLYVDQTRDSHTAIRKGRRPREQGESANSPSPQEDVGAANELVETYSTPFALRAMGTDTPVRLQSLPVLSEDHTLPLLCLSLSPLRQAHGHYLLAGHCCGNHRPPDDAVSVLRAGRGPPTSTP